MSPPLCWWQAALPEGGADQVLQLWEVGEVSLRQGGGAGIPIGQLQRGQLLATLVAVWKKTRTKNEPVKTLDISVSKQMGLAQVGLTRDGGLHDRQILRTIHQGVPPLDLGVWIQCIPMQKLLGHNWDPWSLGTWLSRTCSIGTWLSRTWFIYWHLVKQELVYWKLGYV